MSISKGNYVASLLKAKEAEKALKFAKANQVDPDCYFVAFADFKGDFKSSYEFGYNAACAAAQVGDIKAANEYISVALSTCKDFCESEELNFNEESVDLRALRTSYFALSSGLFLIFRGLHFAAGGRY